MWFFSALTEGRHDWNNYKDFHKLRIENLNSSLDRTALKVCGSLHDKVMTREDKDEEVGQVVTD